MLPVVAITFAQDRQSARKPRRLPPAPWTSTVSPSTGPSFKQHRPPSARDAKRRSGGKHCREAVPGRQARCLRRRAKRSLPLTCRRKRGPEGTGPPPPRPIRRSGTVTVWDTRSTPWGAPGPCLDIRRVDARGDQPTSTSPAQAPEPAFHHGSTPRRLAVLIPDSFHHFGHLSGSFWHNGKRLHVGRASRRLAIETRQDA